MGSSTQQGRPEHFRQWRDSLKKRVFTAYGSRCACCGESRPRFLTIDHVQNDGAEHRRRLGRNAYSSWLDMERRGFPPEYRLACWNCNSGRYYNGGTCPHEAQEAVFNAFYRRH